MTTVLDKPSAEEFINPVPEHQVNAFPGIEFGSMAPLIEDTHYSTLRLIVKNPVPGLSNCAYTQGGFPFFWTASPNDFEVTTASGYGLWTLSPVLTGILTTATALLRLLERYEELGIPETVAESLLEQREGLIDDGRSIASRTGYADAFREILD